MMLKSLKEKISDFFQNVQLWPSPPFISFSPTSYKINGEEMRVFSDTTRRGDLILRRYDRYLTSKMIPGFYSHVGLVTAKDKIVHALYGKGVVEEDILNYLRCDHALILRLKDTSPVERAVSVALDMVGRPYDVLFRTSDKKALYCTELAIHSYVSVIPEDVKKKNRVEPDELLELEAFEVVFSTTEHRVQKSKS